MENKETIKITNIGVPALYKSNFLVNEFWLPAKQDFDCYVCLVQALDVIRNYFNMKWFVTSTYRPADPLSMPDAHRKQPPAIDSVCCDRMQWPVICGKIRNELKNWEHSKLIHDIVATGCNVIIIENNCLHIQHRDTNLHYPVEFATGVYFGEWSPPNTNTAYSHS